MSFRTFEINVGKSSISPAVISNAGYQGEHNATELSFKLDSDVISELNKEQTNGKKLYYRFDAYDGAGGKNSTEPKEVVSLSTSYIYVLENWITKSGINLKVNLIFTAIKDNETEVEVFSGAVQLQLKNSPEGEDISGENNESLSSLYVATQEYAKRAENAEQSAAASEEVCTEAAEKTTEARLALEEGAIWVFDGGTASVTVREKITIDNAMSDVSKNSVENNVVKKYVDDNIKSLDDKCAEAISNIYNEPVSIENGGTGATTAEEARNNLGIASAISEFSLGSISGGAVYHKFNLDNGLKCVVGRASVNATFGDPLTDDLKLYTVIVDMPWVDEMPSALHQVLVSLYFNPRPMWVQAQSYDYANKKFSVRLISTSNSECSPYVHYMIIGK